MGYFKATIEVLVEAECEASACDAVSEGLRPILREFAESGESNLIDWRYAPNGDPEPSEGEGFEYGPAAAAHPSFPQVDWTNADEAAACAEGWAIYEAHGGLEIEKNDTNDSPYEGAPSSRTTLRPWRMSSGALRQVRNCIDVHWKFTALGAREREPAVARVDTLSPAVTGGIFYPTFLAALLATEGKVTRRRENGRERNEHAARGLRAQPGRGH